MKRYQEILTIAVLGGAMLGCNGNDGPMSSAAEKDSAQIDKLYVPALFYSGMTAPKNYVQDASNTLDGTNKVWGDFKATYANYFNWGSYFGAVDGNFTTASDHYSGILDDPSSDYPADLTTAHDALESMRNTWASMREASGSRGYFFDSVTAAHHTMEPVAGASKAFSSSAMQEADLIVLQTALGNTLPAFSDDWDALASNYDDGSTVTDIYDLGTDKSAFLAANISGMEDMITSLSAVVETCNSADYVPPALGKGASVPVAASEIPTDDCGLMIYYSGMIKGKFIPVFLALGDFINSFMSDIIASNRAMIPVTFCTGNPGHAKCGSGSIPQIQYYMNAYFNGGTQTGAMMNFGAHVMPILQPLNWAEGMNSAMTAAGTAWGIIANATDLPTIQTAHPEIEKISAAMYDICAVYENQVTVMTRMGEYHGAFEAIVGVVSVDGVAKETLTVEEITSINDSMAALQGAFANLNAQSAVIDFAAWDTSIEVLDPLLADISDSIDALVAALAGGDEATIISTSMALKSNYIPFFITFGDFSYTPST